MSTKMKRRFQEHLEYVEDGSDLMGVTRGGDAPHRVRRDITHFLSLDTHSHTLIHRTFPFPFPFPLHSPSSTSTSTSPLIPGTPQAGGSATLTLSLPVAPIELEADVIPINNNNSNAKMHTVSSTSQPPPPGQRRKMALSLPPLVISVTPPITATQRSAMPEAHPPLEQRGYTIIRYLKPSLFGCVILAQGPPKNVPSYSSLFSSPIPSPIPPQQQSRQMVVVKISRVALARQRLASDEDGRVSLVRESVLHEAAILRAANGSNNVAQLVDEFQEMGFHYLVTAYAGGELFDGVSSHAVSLDQARRYASQLIDGVSHLHSIGIAHLDLSLTNVCVEEETQTLKIIDFGIADFKEEPSQPLSTSSAFPSSISPSPSHASAASSLYSSPRSRCSSRRRTLMNGAESPSNVGIERLRIESSPFRPFSLISPTSSFSSASSALSTPKGCSPFLASAQMTNPLLSSPGSMLADELDRSNLFGDGDDLPSPMEPLTSASSSSSSSSSSAFRFRSQYLSRRRWNRSNSVSAPSPTIMPIAHPTNNAEPRQGSILSLISSQPLMPDGESTLASATPLFASISCPPVIPRRGAMGRSLFGNSFALSANAARNVPSPSTSMVLGGGGTADLSGECQGDSVLSPHSTSAMVVDVPLDSCQANTLPTHPVDRHRARTDLPPSKAHTQSPEQRASTKWHSAPTIDANSHPPSWCPFAADTYSIAVILFEMLTGARWNGIKYDECPVNPFTSQLSDSLWELIQSATRPEPTRITLQQMRQHTFFAE